jgi:ribosome-associated protein
MFKKPNLPSEGDAASKPSTPAPTVGGPTLDAPGVASIPLAEIEFEFVRSSGPGGQNVNKVASKARLRWRPGERLAPDVWARFQRLYPSWTTEGGEIVVSCQKFRDAPKNKAECLEKLRAALEKAGRTPKKRIPTKPTRGSVLRRLADKKRNSDKKKERGRRDFD